MCDTTSGRQTLRSELMPPRSTKPNNEQPESASRCTASRLHLATVGVRFCTAPTRMDLLSFHSHHFKPQHINTTLFTHLLLLLDAIFQLILHVNIVSNCPKSRIWLFIYIMPSVLWRCWLGGRKGIRPVKNRVVGYWHGYLSGARCRLAPPSWCHCHSLSLAAVKSRLVLPFWYRLTQVVLEKRPLNGWSVVVVVIYFLPSVAYDPQWEDLAKIRSIAKLYSFCLFLYLFIFFIYAFIVWVFKTFRSAGCRTGCRV